MGHLIPFRKYLILLFVFEVSAHPTNHYSYQLPRDISQKLKTGTASSLAEIDFHPLRDFDASHPLRTVLREEKQHEQQHPKQRYNIHLQDDVTPVEEELQGRTEAIKYFHYPFAIGMDGADLSSSSSDNSIYNENYYEGFDDEDKQDASDGNEYERLWRIMKNSARDSGFSNKMYWSPMKDTTTTTTTVQTDDGHKRSAFRAMKREKLRKQSQFMPSVSVGAMTNLGDFFGNLKNNLDILERKGLTDDEMQLLEGDHPVTSLKHELSSENYNIKPTGTAAFLHAVRTYRPSQRVRALVSMTPDNYHGSHFIDPNYMWVGLGK